MTLHRDEDFYFAHGEPGVPPEGLPHCPCPHQHIKPARAEACGRENGNTHIRRVRKGKAVRDFSIPRAWRR